MHISPSATANTLQPVHHKETRTQRKIILQVWEKPRDSCLIHLWQHKGGREDVICGRSLVQEDVICGRSLVQSCSVRLTQQILSNCFKLTP